MTAREATDGRDQGAGNLDAGRPGEGRQDAAQQGAGGTEPDGGQPSELVRVLRETVRGAVRSPEDRDFDMARRPWALGVDQDVQAVVDPVDAADVAALVTLAADRGISLLPQPGGHGATGTSGAQVLVRTRGLTTIDIDPESRRARIGAGVRAGALQKAAAPHGLTGLPGDSSLVSATGIVLGGGLSWFGRAFGWVSDAVVALDVVDAQGRAQHVTAQSDPELFWALRGGGAAPVIVTGVELELREVPALRGGRMLWTAEHAPAVIAAFCALTREAPRDLTTWLTRLHPTGGEPLVGIDATSLDGSEGAEALLGALDALPAPEVDTRGTITADQLWAPFAAPRIPARGVLRGELLDQVDEAALAAAFDAATHPVISLQVRHLGGALEDPSDSPQGALEAPFLVTTYSVPDDSGLPGVQSAHDRVVAALPATGRRPVTFLAPGDTLADALPAASLERLARLRAERDPEGIIRSDLAGPTG